MITFVFLYIEAGIFQYKNSFNGIILNVKLHEFLMYFILHCFLK